MLAVDSNHFLMTVITSAEDVELLLKSYNACTSDDVLRNNVDIDEKPLLVYGTEKRHTMCAKKLPAKYKEIGLEYSEKTVHYVTPEELADFVTKALDKIKNGDEEEEAEEPDLEEEEVIGEGSSESETINEVKVDEVSTNTKEEKKEKAPVPKPKAKAKTKEATGSGGLCQFGVPKLAVEYHSPSVLGLEESLFVNVSEEDVERFFQTFKSKVLRNVERDE